MKLSTNLTAFVRTVFFVLLAALLTFLANAANLHGVLPDSIAVIIAGLAGILEDYVRVNTGAAMFGAVQPKR